MSYTFSFADNGVYSAADVNKITSRLVTSGIEDPFTDGVPYNLSALNDAGMLLYTDGVVPETVSTLKVVRAEEEGKIFIYPGTAFFSDGSVIEVEAGGETLSYTPGVAHYVYLKNDLINTNASYPACTVEAPTGIYVMLAEISASGVITDKRTYAKGKLPGYASCADSVMQITDSIYLPKKETVSEQRVYDIGNHNFRFLISFSGSGGASYAHFSVYKFETGKHFSLVKAGSGASAIDSELRLYSYNNNWVRANVSYADGKLTLDISGFSLSNGDVMFTMYLF